MKPLNMVLIEGGETCGDEGKGGLHPPVPPLADR